MIEKKEGAKNPLFYLPLIFKMAFFVTMTRQELRAALLQAGIYYPPYKKDHPLWQQALKEYIEKTGDTQVSLSCGTCVNKIKRWLER